MQTQSLTQALGPDANGVTAGQNVSEALTNVNVATGNMAEDTEALKHNFFFKGSVVECQGCALTVLWLRIPLVHELDRDPLPISHIRYVRSEDGAVR